MTREQRYLIETESFKEWMRQVLLARQFDESEAEYTAQFATLAAMHEVETHGARKLLHLLDVEMHRSRSCQPAAKHEVIVSAGALEVWDAHLKIGPAIAHLAQQRSAELAATQGVGYVMVRNTNHYGWGGAYALQFMEDGMLSGNLCQGAIPIVTPIAGANATMGCNAVSIALETHSERCPIFLWDAGIGAISWGEVQRRRLEGSALPDGCVVDDQGNVTTDAEAARSILPAGSIGNSLGILIELMAAQIGAGDPRYRSAEPNDVPEGEPVTCALVHFSINLKLFDSLSFPHDRTREENVAAMVDRLLGDNGGARVCGERKWQARQRSERAGGLLFARESIDAFRQEAAARGVALPAVNEVQVNVDPIQVATK